MMAIGLLVAILLGAPAWRVLLRGVNNLLVARAAGKPAPALLQPGLDCLQQLRQGGGREWSPVFCGILVYLAFNVLALSLLVVQGNLFPVIFFQAFAGMGLFLAVFISQETNNEKDAQQEMKRFLLLQPILFAVVAGIILVTGGNKLVAAMDNARPLFLDLPLLFAAVLFVLFKAGERARPEGGYGLLAVLAKVADCYSQVILSILAGVLLVNTPWGAAVAAWVLYSALVFSGPITERWAGKLPFEWSRGILLSGCGFNLVWVYIKYWL